MVGVNEDRSVLTRSATRPDTVARWGPGVDQVADVRLGAPEGPLLLVLHGGFWRPEYDRVHLRPMTEALAAAGWTVATPEYRRVPGDPDVTCGDVRTALATLPAELAAHHDGRVVVLGHSAGGHLALWAAAQASAPGLVGTLALAPVADLLGAERDHLDDGAVVDFLGGPAYGRGDLDPTTLPSAPTPVTVLHGDADRLVPLAQSEAYAGAHPAARLEVLPATGHFAVIDPLSGAWPQVLAAVADLAPPPPRATDGTGRRSP
jgi:acetyl esterase/lipase